MFRTTGGFNSLPESSMVNFYIQVCKLMGVV